MVQPVSEPVVGNLDRPPVQLHSPVEPEQAQAFLRLTAEELAAVQALGALLGGERMEKITSAFYARVTAVPQLRRIIETYSSIPSLKRTFRQYLEELFQGQVDTRYVERRKAIGRTHVRVSLQPGWYMAAYGVLWEEILLELNQLLAARARGPFRGFTWRSSPDLAALRDVGLQGSLRGLHKLLMLDAALAIETYQEREVLQQLDRQAGEHRSRLFALSERLLSLNQQLASASQETAASVQALSAAGSELDADAAQLASSVDRTSRAAACGAAMAGEAVEEADQAGSAAEKTLRYVEGLSQRIAALNQVAQAIEEVADRTNLLALNAAIEAARAGKQGQGFSVVAEEVRRLADQTRQLVQGVQRELASLIEQTRQAVEIARQGQDRASAAAEKSRRAGSAFQDIVAWMEQAATSARHVGEAAAALNRRLQVLQQTSQSLAAQATSVASLAHQLAQAGRQPDGAVKPAR